MWIIEASFYGFRVSVGGNPINCSPFYFSALSVPLQTLASILDAVIKQFSASGYEHSDVVVIDEMEMQRHQQLEKLYRSTRSGKTLSLRSYGISKVHSSSGGLE
ncbi:hypothetical protein L2E82_39854 [Cichorium intybus]|uniref:Uncharacterized protein n=1 Tax=Cichorium intybus TaxID=13427 RepID=A0ACB9AKQ2_CICIN|nr:hypothetical protein L2E82_39854 [Cichorium intybus]